MDPHAPPPARMFQLVTGYWVSQLVGTFAQLGVIDALHEEPLTAAALADRIGVHEEALARVLRAATAVDLLTRDSDERYSPTELGNTLRANVPGSMRDFAIAETAPGHWQPWGRFAEVVRTGERQTLAAFGREIFDYYADNPAEAAAFTGAMQGLSAMVAAEVAQVLDTSAATRVVDVGGAGGTLVRAVLGANPALTGVVLDLPHVVPTARAELAAAKLAGRCEAVGGDFFEQVPEADLYLLKQILHDWDDERCEKILANCARSMRPGGRLAIIEMVIPDDGTPSAAHLMDLNMLTMLTGRERSAREYDALLRTAGLRLDRVVQTSSPFQIALASAA